MAYRKISARRNADFVGPRRSRPPVRKQNQELKQLLEQEDGLYRAIVSDVQIRAAFQRAGTSHDPLTVFRDFDHTFLHTELAPSHYPDWNNLSERMKAHVGFLAGLALHGHDGINLYSFTAKLDPDLQDRWLSQDKKVNDRIQRRIRKALEKRGMEHLAYWYAVEGRSKSAKNRTPIHLHGYALVENNITGSLWTVLEEAMLHRGVNSRHLRRAIQVEQGYDRTDAPRGPGRWVNYAAKNVHRYDKRFRGRRVFMSRQLTGIARALWELMRTPD